MTQRPPNAPVHGGDLARAGERFGRPAEGWLDLSTGINPCPYPHTEISPELLARLPSSSALDGLLAAARAAYAIPPGAGLCAGPGTQAILQALPDIAGNDDVAVISPTYGEHAHIWRRAGRRVTEVASLDRADGAGIVVVVNPNNPDGRLTEPEALDSVRARLAATGGLLVVDEAFADVAPQISVASATARKGLLVLRSFGKFFGLAGLRLGFAAGHPDLTDALAARLGPWAVPGPAIEIGARALADAEWIAATRSALAAARERLDRLLASHGLDIVGGTDLYRLVRCDDAPALFKKPAEAGILVRDFPDRPALLRFGLPGSDADFDRLDRALG